MSQLLPFPSSVERDPAIEVWMREHSGDLGAIARRWFEVMTACVADAAFAYVNAFKAHVKVGFFRGAEFMRHVKPQT